MTNVATGRPSLSHWLRHVSPTASSMPVSTIPGVYSALGYFVASSSEMIKQFTTRWSDVARPDDERSPPHAAVVCRGHRCRLRREGQRRAKAVVNATKLPIHRNQGVETPAAPRRLRGERSTGVFCPIWRRTGSSMGVRCSSGCAGKVRPAI